jgi:hypothetical protein
MTMNAVLVLLGAGAVGMGSLRRSCEKGGADEFWRFVPQREQNTLSTRFWFPQLGQYLVAGCIGAVITWRAPQDGQNLLLPAMALPQYWHLLTPTSTISMKTSNALKLFKLG